jgi:uncharacterized protein involved in exopolysaccharide biosynthesis
MPEAQETRKKWTPRDVLRIVFRHRMLFVVGASLFAIVALAVIPRLPQFEKKYTGRAVFELRTETAAAAQRRGQSDSIQDIKPTLRHDLSGRKAMKQAVEDLGLTKGMPQKEGVLAEGEDPLTEQGQKARLRLVERFREAVDIGRPVRAEHVTHVSVSFTHEDPELARDLPNTLVKNYILTVSKRIEDDLEETRKFLKEELRAAEKRVEAKRKDLIAFEEAHRGMLPDSPRALEDRLRDVTADMNVVRRQQKTARQNLERLEALAKEVEEKPDEVIQKVKGPNPELRRLEAELRARQDQMDGFEETLQDYRIVRHMKDEHPQVEALKAKMQTTRDKITELEKQIEETDEMVFLEEIYGQGRISEQVKVELAAARSQAEVAEDELQRLQERWTSLQDHITASAPIRYRYEDIRKEVERLQAERKRWQDLLDKVEMDLAAEVAKKRSHLNAIELAEMPFRPSSPTLFKVLGFPLVGGLAFGAALVFLAHFVDRRVSTSRDAEQMFGLPVCGVIAEIVPQRRRLKRKAGFAAGLALVLALVGAVGVLCLNDVLWLHHPEAYTEWKDAPVAYIQTHVEDLARRAKAKVEREF